MSVMIPTAPFDLGNGQHGVIVEGIAGCVRCGRWMTIDGTSETIVINARGGFRHGVCDSRWDACPPPRWVLDALEPCGTCKGLGCTCPGFCERYDDHVCPDCHDGKPVVEFQVPCPGSRTACPPFSRAMCRFGGEQHPAGRWTVTEALPIVDTEGNDGPRSCVGVDITSEIARYDEDGWVADVHLPGDPADLIGKYLVLVEAVS